MKALIMTACLSSLFFVILFWLGCMKVSSRCSDEEDRVFNEYLAKHDKGEN